MELYDAYRIALREHKLRSNDSSEDPTFDPEQSTTDLRTFLDELISGSQRGKQLAETQGFCYQVRE